MKTEETLNPCHNHLRCQSGENQSGQPAENRNTPHPEKTLDNRPCKKNDHDAQNGKEKGQTAYSFFRQGT